MDTSRNGRVLKYAGATRILHWTNAVAFVALVVTGAFLYFPPLSFLATDSWSRLVHRLAALVFIGAPLIYALRRWRKARESVREALTWTEEDLGWLVAAPKYYFLGDETAMPPQGHLNTGQKLWYLILLVSGSVLILTGIMMWWLKSVLPAAVFQWSVFAHDVYFIVVLAMFLVHVYLSVLHPLMRQHGGTFSSMINGTITAEYARTHHAKWYEDMAARKEIDEPADNADSAAAPVPQEK